MKKKKNSTIKGKRIIITRSASGDRSWQNYFKKRGAVVYDFPTIEIVPIKMNPEMAKVLARIEDFDWVIATSIQGLYAVNIPPKHVASLAVLGEETEKTARSMGYRKIFHPSISNTTALAWELKLRKNPSVLFLRSMVASRKLATILTARGATVTDLPVYRTLPIKTPDPHFSKLLKSNAIDYLTFASPSAVRGFFARVDKKLHKNALGIRAIAIGPRVAKVLEKYGFKDIRVAAYPTAKGMAEAVI